MVVYTIIPYELNNVIKHSLTKFYCNIVRINSFQLRISASSEPSSVWTQQLVYTSLVSNYLIYYFSPILGVHTSNCTIILYTDTKVVANLLHVSTRRLVRVVEQFCFSYPLKRAHLIHFYPWVDTANLRKDEERTHGKQGMRRHRQIFHLMKLSGAQWVNEWMNEWMARPTASSVHCGTLRYSLKKLYMYVYIYIYKGKAVSLQDWSGPEGSRKLRFPDYVTTALDGGKVVSLTHRPPLPPGNAPGTHFC